MSDERSRHGGKRFDAARAAGRGHGARPGLPPGKQTIVASKQWPTASVAGPGKRTLVEKLQLDSNAPATPPIDDLYEQKHTDLVAADSTNSAHPASGGAVLSELPFRTELEQSFGRPLGHLQAYTGASMELAPYGARALATENIVAFADTTPSPALVAHEVAHTVQNEQAGAAMPMTATGIGPSGSTAEAEADAVAGLIATHSPGVRLPPIAAAPGAHIQLSPGDVAAQWLDKRQDAARLRSLIAMRQQPEIVELLEQNAALADMNALHHAYGSMMIADIQGAVTEAAYLARARVYLGEQMPLDAKLRSRGQGDIQDILGDLEKLSDARALALIAGEAVPIAWTQPATASALATNTTLTAVKQALRERVSGDDYYRAMRTLLGKAERALAVQVAQAPPGPSLEGFTVTMADLGAAHAHMSPLALSPVSLARVDLAETRIREIDGSGNWMADPMKIRIAALAMTDLSGSERQALAMRLRDRPLANTIGGGMLTADALEHDNATAIKKAIVDVQTLAAVQTRAAHSVGLDVAMERAGELVRAARAELEALPTNAPEAEHQAAQAKLTRLESMFFGASSPMLAMMRTTTQRAGDADGGVGAIGAQLRTLGADSTTIAAEQLRAVPAADIPSLIATLRKIAAHDRISAMQRAGLLDTLSSGSLKVTPDQREQVSALVWQGAEPLELSARKTTDVPAPTREAPIVMPPMLSPPLMGPRPELVIALHDILDAMDLHAVHDVLGQLARMSDADQHALYADPRFRAKFNALPEGDAKSAAGHFKESLRVAQTSGAVVALRGYPTDIESEHKVHVEAIGAQVETEPGTQANLRRAYVLVEHLGGPKKIRGNPALLLSLAPSDRDAVERLIGRGAVGGAGLLGKRDQLSDDDDKETANQLIFGQPGLVDAGAKPGAITPATEAEFMYYRLREAADIRSGVAIADWLSTAGPSADESVAEFMVLYQRVHSADIGPGELAQLADLYYRALRRLDRYRAAAASLAGTAAQIVGATVATIVVTVASGGTLGPVAVGAMASVSAAASSAAAGAALRTRSTLSSMLRDAGTGAIEGLTAAAGASLAARVIRGATVGLPASRAAASVGAHAAANTSQAGAEIAAAVIDGALGGASGELFQTATDEATWDRGVAEAIAAMLAAIERGAAIGAAMGGSIGVGAQAIKKLGRVVGKATSESASAEATHTEATHTEPTDGSEHVHERFGPQKMETTGASPGVDPTPESIRQGTVRMEDHPDFPQVLEDLQAKGYEFTYDNRGAPRVKIVETVSSDGKPIGLKKYLFANRGMRWIDLEHELGHVGQMEAMESPMVTHRVLEDGREYTGPNRGGYLTEQLNAVTEYHNRLIEYFRLKERGVDPELLQAHADEVRKWRKEYLKKGKAERSPTVKNFIGKNLPDLPELDARWLAEQGGSL
jgi:hypothetical protein